MGARVLATLEARPTHVLVLAPAQRADVAGPQRALPVGELLGALWKGHGKTVGLSALRNALLGGSVQLVGCR
jgi:hypothetical protein